MGKPYTILEGDCREVIATLPEQHFHCCVTSPPYFGLRDYGVDGQIGLEPTPDEFVAAMVEVFRGVWRVLRDDGVAWLNLGDSYGRGERVKWSGDATRDQNGLQSDVCYGDGYGKSVAILPNKQLIGIPWRVAFALQADGWYLRDAVIWHKPDPMPGSQRDRCTSSYEFVFQLTKKARYFFDLEAVKEPSEPISVARLAQDIDGQNGSTRAHGGVKSNGNMKAVGGSFRTPRNVWKIAHEGFNGAHFATFPRELPMRCIKASTSERGCCPACGAPWVRVVEKDRVPTRPGCNSKIHGVDYVPTDSPMRGHKGIVCGNRDAQRHVTETSTVGWEPGCGCYAAAKAGKFWPECKHQPRPVVTPCRVLDPFNGAGTTGIAACQLGREYTGIELNPEYAKMARERIARELCPSTARTETDEPAPLFGSN